MPDHDPYVEGDVIALHHLPAVSRANCRALLSRLREEGHWRKLGRHAQKATDVDLILLRPDHHTRIIGWDAKKYEGDAPIVGHVALIEAVPRETMNGKHYHSKRYARRSPDLPKPPTATPPPTPDPMPEPTEPDLLTKAEFDARSDLIAVSEFAEAAGVPRTTPYHAMERGDLTEGPGYRWKGKHPNRSIVLDEKAMAYIAQHNPAKPQEPAGAPQTPAPTSDTRGTPGAQPAAPQGPKTKSPDPGGDALPAEVDVSSPDDAETLLVQAARAEARAVRLMSEAEVLRKRREALTEQIRDLQEKATALRTKAYAAFGVPQPD